MLFQIIDLDLKSIFKPNILSECIMFLLFDRKRKTSGLIIIFLFYKNITYQDICIGIIEGKYGSLREEVV